jgi:hypothetical protein
MVLGVGAQAPDQVRELDAIPHKEHLHAKPNIQAVIYTFTKPIASDFEVCWVFHDLMIRQSNTIMLSRLMEHDFCA